MWPGSDALEQPWSLKTCLPAGLSGLAQEAKIAAASLPRGGALRAIRTAKRMDGEEGSCPGSPRTPASGFDTPTNVVDQCDTPRSGVLSNLARRLLEKANSRGSSCPRCVRPKPKPSDIRSTPGNPPILEPGT